MRKHTERWSTERGTQAEDETKKAKLAAEKGRMVKKAMEKTWTIEPSPGQENRLWGVLASTVSEKKLGKKGRLI